MANADSLDESDRPVLGSWAFETTGSFAESDMRGLGRWAFDKTRNVGDSELVLDSWVSEKTGSSAGSDKPEPDLGSQALEKTDSFGQPDWLVPGSWVFGSDGTFETASMSMNFETLFALERFDFSTPRAAE